MRATPTPTPWKVTRISGKLLIDSDVPDYFIAEMIDDSEPEQVEANARLIVTAVNHHQELREELDTLCQAVEGHRAGALTNDGLWHYVTKARQLLARLDGAEREGQGV